MEKAVRLPVVDGLLSTAAKMCVGDQDAHKGGDDGHGSTMYPTALLRKVSEQASFSRGLRSQKKWGTWGVQNERQVGNTVWVRAFLKPASQDATPRRPQNCDVTDVA